MCVSNPSWTDYVTAIGTAATAIAAGYAAITWRWNLRQQTKHNAAVHVLEQCSLFRYLFYDARNPLYPANEFPPEYHAKDDRTNNDEASGWAFVYGNRWKILGPQILELAKLRARAGAVLGPEVATAIEELAKKGRELSNFMSEHISQMRAGSNIVRQWADQDWVKRVKESVSADPDPRSRDDAYSKDFEEKYRRVESLVQPFV
jgi:hypothetical protein